MTELPKTFDPAEIEARWYAHWEGAGLFRPERPEAEPFTIVIPPPNVTGSLHIGHALDNTLQDILIRHARLQGKDALWVVGMDHAGIATQMVVERRLEERQDKRTNYSREEFVAKVWEWKAESGGQITRQLRRLGASCDWANERFTMDEGFCRAVTKVFVQLYRDGLLYRDKRLVNWDPKFGTAISDLEVETREVQGKFWHLKYPLEDGSGFIHVATTRPETMLADMAVAVHPEDERYRALVGRKVRLPITGRRVPIVADEHADPELGSGAVKITPGHDFNDFEVGRRVGIKPGEMLNMLSGDAKVVQTADGLVPAELVGLDRFEARKRVVELLEEGGFLERVEDRVIQLPYGDRSGVVIEPWLTDQWYVDAKTLAQQPIEAVRSGDIRVVPKSWEKTWFNWLENIQPWCVSRQLWWGHRIPAWASTEYRRDGDDLISVGTPHIFVAETEAEAISEAKTRAGDRKIVVFDSFEEGIAGFERGEPSVFDDDVYALIRDPDVLDTWFSSALWPFATLGWPEETEELKRHYPNDVLISGFDIIFFWDARMAMQGFHFMGEKPWKTLYLHGLVRDAKGQKMSKSKGNTVDPLGLIDRYGADALRFTLAAMESQGRDIKLDEKRVEGYRNFATKLWNAARFCQANGIGASAALEPPRAELPVNRWIVSETVKTVQALDLALAEFRFDESANTIYHFVWATFCDWYLELIKGQIDEETRAVAAWVLDQILVMLHPFMPFITEELWSANPRPYPLILAKWPMPDARSLDPEAGSEIEWLIRTITEIRSARTEVGVPPSALINAWMYGASPQTSQRMLTHHSVLRRMARIGSVSNVSAPNQNGLQVVIGEATLFLEIEGVIDVAAERARLEKAAQAAEKERDSLAARLSNPSFVERAKPEAVEKAREDHASKASDAERYRAALARLG
ncbi:MAG: valyl-tRNA synthetase [Sphingomonadales bacterium]|jgi:valyl-tRNA synthetase|nr:valyl-tRNA synthetase [Sphingomonadales bacterium]